MSVLAQALLAEARDNLADAKSTLLKLRGAQREVIAVRDYWTSVQEYEGKCEDRWRAELFDEERLWYRGPGGFCVRFESGTTMIGAACRWSGFCAIPELQKIHAEAFVAITRALGESTLITVLDGAFLDDHIYDGLTRSEYINLLVREWGEPRTEIGIVNADVDDYLKKARPVWFLIDL